MLPFPMRLSWETETTVRHLTCHREVARSLSRIFDAIWTHFGGDIGKIRAAGMDLLGGCYNYRPRRNGSGLSMHAWGAAIDFDPDHNGLRAVRPDAITPEVCAIPKAIVEIFKAEGWSWGGDWDAPYDPMHFEATTRPHVETVTGEDYKPEPAKSKKEKHAA